MRDVGKPLYSAPPGCIRGGSSGAGAVGDGDERERAGRDEPGQRGRVLDHLQDREVLQRGLDQNGEAQDSGGD